jgi:hypothetical protein
VGERGWIKEGKGKGRDGEKSERLAKKEREGAEILECLDGRMEKKSQRQARGEIEMIISGQCRRW